MSSSVFFIYLVGWNRLMYIFCGVNTWQNGTRCRDGVKVLWCHSHLVWLVFEGSIPTCVVFIQKTFVTCSCCFFLGIVREKRGGRGG